MALTACSSGPKPSTSLGGLANGPSPTSGASGLVPSGGPGSGSATPPTTRGGGSGGGVTGGSANGGGGQSDSPAPLGVTALLDHGGPASADACPTTFTATGTIGANGPVDTQYKVEVILNDARELDSDPIAVHFDRTGSQPLTYTFATPLAPNYKIQVSVELLGKDYGTSTNYVIFHTACNATEQSSRADYGLCGQVSSLIFTVLQPIGPQRQVLQAEFYDAAHPDGPHTTVSYPYDFPAGTGLIHDYKVSRLILKPGQVIAVIITMPSGVKLGPYGLKCTGTA
ncbi:MAG TPA: hypothetical protein VKB59_23095 [Micromonosporaceae bacterium]|nr:hypothetical protein [Micromonosporaceae bacterium]